MRAHWMFPSPSPPTMPPLQLVAATVCLELVHLFRSEESDQPFDTTCAMDRATMEYTWSDEMAKCKPNRKLCKRYSNA
jgi:hypothetical protein